MKITHLKAHPISVPLETPFYFSQGWVDTRSSVLVELRTDSGLTGWGESLCHGQQPPQVSAAFVEHALKPLVVGQRLCDVELIWESMYSKTRPYGQAGTAVNAISGVDIAIWDALGKHHDAPVHELIGGAFRQSVVPYATGFYRVAEGIYPQDSVEEAKRYVEEGFSAFKLKIGFGVGEDIQLIKAVRSAVGVNIRMMADANGAYTVAEARSILNATADCDVYFFEELLPPEDITGYQQIRNLSSARIAAGEQVFGRYGFRDWLAVSALDIVQPDLCSSGGFTECKKIAAMAQAYNTPLIPHVWGSGVGLAASLQFIASLPNTPLSVNADEPMLEYDRSSHPFRTDLIHGGISMADGLVGIPKAPGIGVTVNRDIISRYQC